MRTVAVRTERGPLHLAMPVGRSYVTACNRTLTGTLWLYKGRDRARAWDLELLCVQCSGRADRAESERALARVCGW